jgi:predicted N-formylglutamate amidohydrolase
MSGRPLIISCEHATNDVPKAFAALFKGEEALLATHRGFDPGAAELAERFACSLGAPLERSLVTRLIVDLNRSEYNPSLFSKFTGSLHAETRQAILNKYYRPFRARVLSLAEEDIEHFGRVVHLSVHSFTPELDGVARQADIGLLYDPSRGGERRLVRRWKDELERRAGDLLVRLNYPYRGTADGHVTALRSRFSEESYLGVELEVNQNRALGPREAWDELQVVIVESFAASAGNRDD